jgi:phosphoserine phosphatase RsbU/P
MATVTLSYTDTAGNHEFSLNRDSISIGRSQDQDIVLGDPCVSRQHALIVREGDTYSIVDQNSTHGTYLNSVRVRRSTLRLGDVLQLGSPNGMRLRFHLPSKEPTHAGFMHSGASGLLSSLSELRIPTSEQRPAAQEMEKLNWLLRAARQLNEGGEIDDLLSVFLHLALQLTGLERGFVFLQKDGEMRLAQGLGADGQILDEDSTISRKAMRRAIDNESEFSISNTIADEDAAGWSSVMANSIRSICCIPLRKRTPVKGSDRLLGLLYLDSRIGQGNLANVDHQLLDTIATEATTLLHNAVLAEEEHKARKEREELAVAAQIHSNLMSIAMPKLRYWALEAKSVPCLAIGGDFYDIVALDDSVFVTIADVSGKGVSAAIVAATLQGIIHSQCLAGQSLAEIAGIVNRFLCTRDVGKYATMILLRLFPDGYVEYMNCGHVPALVIRGTQIRHIVEGNTVVGLISDATFASTRFVLHAGEQLILLTDGITEAEDVAGNQFGDAGLNAIANYDNIDAILDHVMSFQAPNLAQDDCTLIGVRYTGE